jgi:hypothetical protein
VGNAELRLDLPKGLLWMLIGVIAFNGICSARLAWVQDKNNTEYADKCHAALMDQINRK